jgi:hypothetical protein
MPRTSAQARSTARFSLENPPQPLPSDLSEEQQKAWREICADLRSGHIRFDTVPVLAKLVSHLSYNAKLAEQLGAMREAELTGRDSAGKNKRSVYLQLAQAHGEESRLVAVLNTKLRFTVQARDDSVAAERARKRTPVGPKPWEIQPWDDPADDDENDGEPTTN